MSFEQKQRMLPCNASLSHSLDRGVVGLLTFTLHHTKSKNIHFKPAFPAKVTKYKEIKMNIEMLTCDKHFCVQKGKAKGQKFEPQVDGHIWRSAVSLRNSTRPPERQNNGYLSRSWTL